LVIYVRVCHSYYENNKRTDAMANMDCDGDELLNTCELCRAKVRHGC
jgi:hypothetical protein